MLAYYKTEVPFLRLVLAFGLGIIVSVCLNLAPSFPINFTFYCLIALCLWSALTYKKAKLYLKRPFTGALIYSTVFFAGISISNQRKEIYHEQHFSRLKAEKLVVLINEKPKINKNYVSFLAQVKATVKDKKLEDCKGKLLIDCRMDSAKSATLTYGDVLLVDADYKETEAPKNPAEFNYKRYLQLQNIYHKGSLQAPQLQKLDSDCGNPIIAFALRFREAQVAKFNAHLQNNEAKAVASTLILGYRAQLDHALMLTYSNTGTMHVLSVSGMHVAIVAGFLSFLLSFMNKKRSTRLLKTILMVTLIWFYALTTGLAPSVTRAAIMISFVLIAKAYGKRVNVFNILGLSALMLLIYNPFYLFDVGFQLSYIAVGGLIFIYPKIKNCYCPQNYFVGQIWSVMAVSIAAQLITAPFSMFYFHQFPVYFLLSNVFIVLPAAVVMYVGFVFLSLASVFPNVEVPAKALEYAIVFMNEGLKKIEVIPHGSINQLWHGFFEIGLLYAALFCIICAHKNIRYLRLSCLFLAVFVCRLSYLEFTKMQQQNLMVFNVPKHRALALLNGRDAIVVSDLSTTDNAFQFSVKPYLDSCQVQNIKMVDIGQVQALKFKNTKLYIGSGKNTPTIKTDWLLSRVAKKSQVSYHNNTLSENNLYSNIYINNFNVNKATEFKW
ncbi:hypothetical protein BCY91_07555 [Pelobium manganitolerans]|uniref:Competence protein ComEC n=1 Tax=Pelobium manganitolerans TaxID=1842495 RepID=A0A419S3V8_9SPHI|nr:ComEC/Rec2 family competence protein [Pelobium manganitolerans]RKD14333.1 hypothetical protein BCY91_07555 [Pelobium manganitolerans]